MAKTSSKKANVNIDEVMSQMPHSTEAEQALLCSILTDKAVARDMMSNIKEEDFYVDAHRLIFSTLQAIDKAQQPIDVVTLVAKLNQLGIMKTVGGMTMINQLLESTPSSSNADHYLKIVKQNSLRREVIKGANSVIKNAYTQDNASNALDFAQKTMYNIGQGRESSELQPISKITMEVMDRLSKSFESPDGEGFSGLKVYLDNIDNMTGGFRPGQLIVLAARPGCGKTSYSMNIVANIAKNDPDKVIAVFNLEMSGNELGSRLLSNLAQLDSKQIKEGGQDTMEPLWAAAALINDSKLYIDDSAMITAEQIMSKCRKLKAQEGRLDFVLVDYLQLLTSSTPELSKQQQVADMSRLMKIMAKDLEVPVMVLSQMSRKIDDREDKTPMLSDLRESGAIEQDADMVFFLTEGDFEIFNGDEAPIKLIIAKHRNGEVGELDYKWNKATMTFIPVDPDDVIHLPAEELKKAAEKKELEKLKIKEKAAEPVENDDPNEIHQKEEDYVSDDLEPIDDAIAPPIEDNFVPSNEDDLLASLKK